ncbi:MAG: response regulator [Candidatus Buchananbacteria bacterium]|nr:response regulator [Candidatus Buchananbacteria bacterium]
MAKKKILIIEDDKSLVNLIKDAINPKKYEVVLALEAKEGSSKAITENPDIILLDILLPEEDGFACLRYLKDHPKTAKIPVIILSNLGQDEEIRKGIELGAKDYLVKADSSIDDIMQKVEKYIN